MKKVLIICAAGMSSSMMAKKTTEYFKEKGQEIEVDAVPATEGDKLIQNSDFDLFLISPQTTMYLDKFKKIGDKSGKPVVGIPFPAYIPVPSGIEQMATLITDNL